MSTEQSANFIPFCGTVFSLFRLEVSTFNRMRVTCDWISVAAAATEASAAAQQQHQQQQILLLLL
jgi:hypothetical protein